MKQNIKKIISEIDLILSTISDKEVERLVDEIIKARKIITIGAGRVGMMARAFAMRLGHLGLQSFTTADATIPAIGKEDLLIVCSGSGETQAIYDLVLIGKTHGVKVCAITARVNSKIGKAADFIVSLKAPTKVDKDPKIKSIQPMTTLNEQCLMIFFDAVVLELMRELNETEDSMWSRHSNLE
ncbi:SIS domain-containing protein [Candidatus Daviesbacteria bacterium]|nr:SIS domain-containing protein [Candidatus Daviesbacteria bacterium]